MLLPLYIIIKCSVRYSTFKTSNQERNFFLPSIDKTNSSIGRGKSWGFSYSTCRHLNFTYHRSCSAVLNYY